MPLGQAGQALAAQNGATARTFEAPAGEIVFTAAALTAAPGYVSALQGTLVPSPPFVFTAIGTMPANGQLALTIPNPAQPAAAGAQQVLHQAIFGVAPGIAPLGSPSTLLWLDPTY